MNSLNPENMRFHVIEESGTIARNGTTADAYAERLGQLAGRLAGEGRELVWPPVRMEDGWVIPSIPQPPTTHTQPGPINRV
jgi:hypothetical protein